MIRNNGVLKLYLNGIEVHSSINTVNYSLTNCTIGKDTAANGSYIITGYIDNLIVSKGIARYTSNIIPSVNELQYGYTQTIFTPVMGDTRSLNVSYTGTLDSVDINTYILD